MIGDLLQPQKPQRKVLGEWISTQLKNYSKKSNIMKNPEIQKDWTEFINDPKYSEYFNTKNPRRICPNLK